MDSNSIDKHLIDMAVEYCQEIDKTDLAEMSMEEISTLFEVVIRNFKIDEKHVDDVPW